MLDPTRNSDELLLRAIVSSPAVKGSVLVLGRSDWMVEELLAKREVTEVIYVPGENCTGLHRTGRLRVMFDHHPEYVQRRDIGRDGVDFLFCDLGGGAWDRGRTARVKKRVHEFRPRATAYRFLQLDIVAEWLGAGHDPAKLGKAAIDLFTKATGIWAEPRTEEFAASCFDTATSFMGKGR